MAKKKARKGKKNSKQFLTEIATDPHKLGRFIHDPEGMMDAAKVSRKDRVHIRNAIAHAVHKQLALTPEAFVAVLV